MSNFKSTNFSNYLKKRVSAQITPGTNDTYEDLLNITKEGYLDEVIANADASSSNTFLKITVDGSIIFEGYTDGYGVAYNSAAYTGIVQRVFNYYQSADIVKSGAFVMNTGVNTAAQGNINVNMRDLPYTGLGLSVAIINTPIYFKTSLRIETKATDKTKKVNYRIEYGTYA